MKSHKKWITGEWQLCLIHGLPGQIREYENDVSYVELMPDGKYSESYYPIPVKKAVLRNVRKRLPASYPKWLYHRTLPACIVHSVEEHMQLGSGWEESPAAFGIETHPGGPPDDTMAEESWTEAEESCDTMTYVPESWEYFEHPWQMMRIMEQDDADKRRAVSSSQNEAG